MIPREKYVVPAVFFGQPPGRIIYDPELITFVSIDMDCSEGGVTSFPLLQSSCERVIAITAMDFPHGSYRTSALFAPDNGAEVSLFCATQDGYSTPLSADIAGYDELPLVSGELFVSGDVQPGVFSEFARLMASGENDGIFESVIGLSYDGYGQNFWADFSGDTIERIGYSGGIIDNSIAATGSDSMINRAVIMQSASILSDPALLPSSAVMACSFSDGQYAYCDSVGDLGTEDFMVSLFVKRANTDSGYIVSFAGTNRTYAIDLYFDSSSHVCVCLKSGTSEQTITSAATITDLGWHFIAFVSDRDGNGLLFIDNCVDIAAVMSIPSSSSFDLSSSIVLCGKTNWQSRPEVTLGIDAEITDFKLIKFGASGLTVSTSPRLVITKTSSGEVVYDIAGTCFMRDCFCHPGISTAGRGYSYSCEIDCPSFDSQIYVENIVGGGLMLVGGPAATTYENSESGYIGKGLLLSDASDIVSGSSVSGADLGSGSFIISFWANFGDTSSSLQASFMGKPGVSAAGYSVGIYDDSGAGKVFLTLQDSGGASVEYKKQGGGDATLAMSAVTSHYVFVGVRSGGNISVYAIKDGQISGAPVTQAYSGDISNVSAFSLSGISGESIQIADVEIYGISTIAVTGSYAGGDLQLAATEIIYDQSGPSGAMVDLGNLVFGSMSDAGYTAIEGYRTAQILYNGFPACPAYLLTEGGEVLTLSGETVFADIIRKDILAASFDLSSGSIALSVTPIAWGATESVNRCFWYIEKSGKIKVSCYRDPDSNLVFLVSCFGECMKMSVPISWTNGTEYEIIAIWSLKDKSLNLYIDGVLYDEFSDIIDSGYIESDIFVLGANGRRSAQSEAILGNFIFTAEDLSKTSAQSMGRGYFYGSSRESYGRLLADTFNLKGSIIYEE